jgi:DNA polymerase sigma
VSAPTGDNIWLWLISLILTSGTAKVLFDAAKDWRNRVGKDQRHVATIDASIVTVAKARDELAEDNARLRATLAEERAYHEADRKRWEGEKANFRSEIAELQAQIRRERDEAERRYAALLQRLTELSERHAPDADGAY